jgi:hypothetical protein
MKRLGPVALVLAVATATVFAQAADPLPPEDPPAAGSSAGSGSAAGSAGSGSATGSAGSGSAGSGSATGSAGSGSATGSAGSGSATGSAAGSGSNAPIVVVIPPDVAVPDVSAAASPSAVRLGEKFTLFITATYAADVEVNVREPIELGPAFEVKRKVSSDRPSPDGRKIREWQLEVYAWELGDIAVPPIAVTFTSQGKAGQLATNHVPMKISGMLGDLVDDPKLVRGDAPPVRLMTRDYFWAWVVGGVAGALAIAIVTLYVLKKRKSRVRTLIGTLVMASAATPRRLDMTSERALERLLALEQSGALDRDEDRKAGYAEMTGVIREYLGGRYHVATLDLTTAELMRSLAKVAPDDERAQIAAWLERCDIVKYGGMHASAGDAHAVLDGARTLVMTTTRAPGRQATKTEAA